MIDASFNIWWGLVGLIPLAVYIVLVLNEVDPLPATILCVVLGAIINAQSPMQVGAALHKSLGSFLALVGLIIMLGRGLGEVLLETKVVHTLVNKIMYGIGINTQSKAIAGIMVASTIIVGLLGTMAGGIAIIAPIVNPIAASVGLTPSVVGVVYQAVGEEALTLGPFTPPVVTLMGLTGISYGTMILTAALPIAIITVIATWFMAKRIQKSTEGVTKFDEALLPDKDKQFQPTPQEKTATNVFIVVFLFLIGFGIYLKAATSYVIFVMIFLSFVVGFVGGLNYNQICKALVKGMAGNVNMFILFLFLDLFINYVSQAGGFTAITYLLMPLIELGGKAAVVISGGAIGAFGISGAVVAELVTLHKMFEGLVAQYNVSMISWTVALIVATRVTSFIIPGGNMVSMMGFAQSKDMKSMLRNGVVVAICQTGLLIIYGVFFS